MNKKGLMNSVMMKTGCTRDNARHYVDAVFESIEECLMFDEDLRISGFGLFCTRQRKARKGRNPATGEPIDIPAYKTVIFKPGARLKNTVNR